jgi:molecular chaperone GrpE
MVKPMGDSKKETKSSSKKEKKLKEALDTKTEEADEYLSQMKYLKADFDNYKKRMTREKEEFAKYANEKLVLEILDVLDNLERALEAAKSGNGSNENLLEGVEITYKQLLSTLEKEGVKCIKAEGEIFDPYLHECVMTENTDKYYEDAVIQEIQKGYKMDSKVIRHSKVKIAKR